MYRSFSRASLIAALAIGVALPVTADAQLRAGFRGTLVPRGDDNFTGMINVGFNLNVRGETYNAASGCMNGLVSLTGVADCPFGTSTLSDLSFIFGTVFATNYRDMDSRNTASGQLGYGTGTVDGRSAFGFTWDGIFTFGSTTDRNFMQLLFIQRSDRAAGDFDAEFNFGTSVFPTAPAVSGFADDGGFSGTAVTTAVTVAANSRTTLCFVGGSVNNAGCNPTVVIPEPSTYALLATGLAVLMVVRRRRVR